MTPPSSSLPQTDSDVAANFWPLNRRLNRTTTTSRLTHRVAANLCELFVYDLSLLVAGAWQTDQLARALFAALTPDQVHLRRLVLGLALSARGCLPALPSALIAEGLVLPSTHHRVIEVLLKPIRPHRRGTRITEPMSVVGARTVGACILVALHLEAEAAQRAEDAWLLGSDRLHQALTGWAATWSDYIGNLRLQERSFRAQAYAAEL